MLSLSQEKISDLIQGLLIMYGHNQKPCSHQHLAKIIDPKAKPVNAIGEWLRGERGLNIKYLTRIAELHNMSALELERYLKDDDDLSDPMKYSEADLKQCENVLFKIAINETVDQCDMEDVNIIIKNLSLSRLSRLYGKINKRLESIIMASQDPKMMMIYQLQYRVIEEMITKLSTYADASSQITF